jgi:hypothetical protein
VESDPRIGLCLGCRHARRVPTPQATYWLCGLAATDPRFERYPRLPVLTCPGFVPFEGVEAPPPEGEGPRES